MKAGDGRLAKKIVNGRLTARAGEEGSRAGKEGWRGMLANRACGEEGWRGMLVKRAGEWMAGKDWMEGWRRGQTRNAGAERLAKRAGE